jgi:hypothetical protein
MIRLAPKRLIADWGGLFYMVRFGWLSLLLMMFDEVYGRSLVFEYDLHRDGCNSGLSMGEYRMLNKIVACLALAIASATLSTSAFALGAQLIGHPELIEFDPIDHVVNKVVVRVNDGWLNSDTFSLAITITGVNDGFHLHGYQQVPLSHTEVLGREKSLAFVGVYWNADTLSTHSPETYTVCVQILANDMEVGDEMCNDFGPF